MFDIVLKNCTIVNENHIFESDIGIKGQRIEKIASSITDEAKETLDLAGKIVMPGVIDDQVHFREPGLTHKGEIATESRAALAGGITSYFEMPNVNPTTTTNELLDKKFEVAKYKSRANYSFYLGASNSNIEEIKKVDINKACGLKVFMGASTGDMLVDNEDTLEDIFQYSPVNIVTHCENTPRILELEKEFSAKYGDNVEPKHHPYIRDEESCYLSSSLAVGLAKKYGSNLHVLHLTTEKEMSLFDAGAIDDKKITAEVCVHHLFFSEKDYETKGNFIKCNPSIKKETDRQALINAVNNDLIDIIATDHAPHTLEEKEQHYLKAPAGLPLVQHMLPALLDFYKKDIFSLEMIVRKTSHNIAKRFKIKDRGYIREGYYADFAIVDMNKVFSVTRENTLYKCGWSPFEGYNLPASIYATILNGSLVYKEGEFLDDSLGIQLEFDR
ncbi:MAG: dihydroorotase [Gammaproteobacteria bacterium]